MTTVQFGSDPIDMRALDRACCADLVIQQAAIANAIPGNHYVDTLDIVSVITAQAPADHGG